MKDPILEQEDETKGINLRALNGSLGGLFFLIILSVDWLLIGDGEIPGK